MSQNTKLQRWIDLVAALLSRKYGVTLEQLRDEVPGYRDGAAESVRRTFERDKDELRRLGVPIETTGGEGDAEARYLVPHDRFYLPYLALVTERGIHHPHKVDQYGYHALGECAFDDDELGLLADAAARVAAFGDPVLAAEVRTAMAKLAVDMPPEHLAPTPGVTLLPAESRADEATLTRLGDALNRRKQVSFTYYGIERDETERRTVLPYGLVYTAGHWYLHCQDPARGALRVFRVSRISDLKVNAKSPGRQDYEIPASFSLAERTTLVPPWELGEDEATAVEVSFNRDNGLTAAARQRGTAVRGKHGVVRYTVRRREPFLRWLLSLNGDATPLGPPDIVRDLRALAERTCAAARGAQ